MNLQEAYTILDIPPGTSPEEAKKKYRELTKKFHPDVNKEEGAEDKFKKINEAYKCVSEGKGTDREEFVPPHNPFNPFGGFSPFGQQVHRTFRADHINLNATISFKESVLGCKRELQFTRNGKCQNCDGQGAVKINNGCERCGGQGQIMNRQGNMLFTRTCDKCFGRSQTIPCSPCGGKCYVEATVSVSVTIPGGITNGNILKLSGMGNFVGNIMNMDQFTDTLLLIIVDKDLELSISGMDVISDIKISLLEALQGSNKTVKTIEGEKEINISPLSKNKEEIILPSLGVNGIGAHRVILNVEYPEDVSNLINVLNGYSTYDPDMIDRE